MPKTAPEEMYIIPLCSNRASPKQGANEWRERGGRERRKREMEEDEGKEERDH